MRFIAVAAILVGAALCATGLLIIPLAIDGFQYHQVDLLSGRNLHISPLWSAPDNGIWLDPQTVTIRHTDPPSVSGQPHRVLNLSPLPIPNRVLGDSILAVLDVAVTGDAMNLFVLDGENLTRWEHGDGADMIIVWWNFQGNTNSWWGLSREDIKTPMYLVLEASTPRPPDITVTLALSASWTPATGAPNFATAETVTPTVAESALDIRLEGEASDANGSQFDLLIFDRMTPEAWREGTQPSPLFEENGGDSHRFLIPLQISDVQGVSLTFVVRNPGYSNWNVDANVLAQIGWWEPALAAVRPFLGTLGVVLGFAGVAVTAGGVLLEVSPLPDRRPQEDSKSARP